MNRRAPPKSGERPRAAMSAVEAYKRWVRRNRELVRSLESLANGVTWLLPERFSNSDIAPEAVYAFLNIVSSVNQHIMDTGPVLGKPWSPKEEHSYPWPLIVSVLKDVEAVVEVAAHHYLGEARKYTFLAVTEGTKAIARFAAYRESGYKMLLQGGEVVNEEKSADEEFGELINGYQSNGLPMSFPLNGHVQNGHGSVPKSLEGRAMAALDRFGENAKMMSHHSHPMGGNWIGRSSRSNADVVKRPSLSAFLSQKGLSGRLMFLGEVIHILRPLIYVLMIRKFGARSWKPWVISLVVDLTGMRLVQYAISWHQNGIEKPYELSTSEQEEWKRRKMILALYVMRDPFFTKYTSAWLDKTEKIVSPVPLIGFLTAKFVELISGAQTRYTYMSGS